MHDMAIAPDTATGELKWHIVSTQNGECLCGAEYNPSEREIAEATDRHCYPCMARLQATMTPPPIG